MDQIYKDETHCLVGPEMRTEADKSISCFCRDAVAEAKYFYKTYLLTRKDRNLNGVFLELEARAREKCGATFDLATGEKADWNGPEVSRRCPPESIIDGYTPNQYGFRNVPYTGLFTFRGPGGNVIQTDSFMAWELLPPEYKKSPCPPSARCPK